jgi:glycyl-tRNA synthetase beta subunit
MWRDAMCCDAASRQVLTAELPGVVGSLAFKKSMRWDGHGTAFSRPLRWLLGLHGDVQLPFVYGGLQVRLRCVRQEWRSAAALCLRPAARPRNAM